MGDLQGALMDMSSCTHTCQGCIGVSFLLGSFANLWPKMPKVGSLIQNVIQNRSQMVQNSVKYGCSGKPAGNAATPQSV